MSASPFDYLYNKVKDIWTRQETVRVQQQLRENRCATLIDYLKDDGEILMYGIGIGDYEGNIYHFRAPAGSTPYDPVWEMVEFDCSTGQATCSLTSVTPYDFVENVIPTTAEQNMAAYGTLFSLSDQPEQCPPLHSGSSGGWMPPDNSPGLDTGIVMSGSESLSVAGWFKISNPSTHPGILITNDDGNLGTNGEFTFYLTSGSLRMDLQHPWHGNFGATTSNTFGLNLGTTHHFGFSLDAAQNGYLRIYIDGVERKNNQHQNSPILWQTSRSLHIGRNNSAGIFGSPDGHWRPNGCLDGFVIAKEVWPASTFLDLYNIGIGS